MRAGLLIIGMTVLIAGCSSSKKPEPTPAEQREELLRHQKDCADPQWKESHLGIWYNVCRDNKGL